LDVTPNRLLFGAVLVVLVALVVWMLVLSTGTPDGPEGLASLARMLIAVGIIVLVIEAIRRLVSRNRAS
jgi:preprotein translocase subunit SecY